VKAEIARYNRPVALAIAETEKKLPKHLVIFRGTPRGGPPLWKHGEPLLSANVTRYDCHQTNLPDGRIQLSFMGGDGFTYPVYGLTDAS
jgi:hypothetical protein